MIAALDANSWVRTKEQGNMTETCEAALELHPPRTHGLDGERPLIQ